MNHNNGIDTRTLSQLKSLSALSSSELERLAVNMTVRRIRKGARIFDQDEAASMAYLLLSGTVKLSLVNQEGRDVLLSLLPPGEIFGLGAFSPHTQHSFRCDAFSDCTVGAIRSETLIDILLGVSGERFLRFNDLAMHSLWTMFLRCIRGLGLSLSKRLALALLELSASFGVPHARGTALAISVTHEDLANSIGVSRQKVSKCLTEFKRRRIVIRDGRQIIVNPQRLCRIIEEA